MTEQPQSHRHRKEQDEPFHPEPSSPAAEHVPMRVWHVNLEAHGNATVTVNAESEDAAEAKALWDQPGFIVNGGEVTWEVLDVFEADES